MQEVTRKRKKNAPKSVRKKDQFTSCVPGVQCWSLIVVVVSIHPYSRMEKAKKKQEECRE